MLFRFDATASADAGSCEAATVDLGEPETADNCAGELTVENDAPDAFPVGETTVTWTVTDVNGNTSTATQLVTVTDDEAPSITAPADATASADAGSCEAATVDLGTPETADNCDGELTVENDAPDAFPVGETTVTWTVTDINGNTATATQLVTVTDDEAPSITAPADATASADAGSCEAAAVDLGEPEKIGRAHV